MFDFARDSASGLGMGLVNNGTTGQESLTVSGGDLGVGAYSLIAGAGKAGCEGTERVSESW